jgi:hypothetical protein
MKIKDLPQNIRLTGTRFIYPMDGKPYYWFSQWYKGVWGKTDMASSEILPLIVNDLKEAMEWEVEND